MITATTKTIGRAQTVLVFTQGQSQKAVLSAIVVRVIDRKDQSRLHFTGPVEFSDSVREHIETVILSIIDRILSALKIPVANFEISAVNLSAASAQDIGTKISGFSADVPMLMAMLSAALQLPIPDNVIATGHIASVNGDIRMVKALPAKVEAIKADNSIRLFIHPDPDRDKSLSVLSPRERDLALEAIMAAKCVIQTQSVANIAEPIRRIFSDDAIVLSSLQQGFYGLADTSPADHHPVDQTIKYLACANEKRFWNELQRFFVAGEDDKAKELLEAFACFHIDRKKYSHHFGTKLRQLVCALPPATRRLKITFPLLGIGRCIKLVQHATEADHNDVPILFDAIRGKLGGQDHDLHVAEPPQQQPDSKSPPFDAVVSQSSQQALAKKIGIPIDSARSSFILESSTTASADEFVDTITAFYSHLQRYTNPAPAITIEDEDAKDKALSLLERTFRNRGGFEAAKSNAADGTNGGLRLILDALTEQFKSERQADYVHAVFRKALDGLEWQEKIDFIKAALQRLAPFLPAEIRSQPPERFARHYETIVQTYVQSFDQVSQLLKTM